MSKDILELYLKISKYEELWELAHKRGKEVKIIREDLKLLLMDHSNALARLDDCGIKYTDPQEKKINIKLSKERTT